jgi:protein-S-isoprenylcysteine O-methyltransferase Ste14
MLYALAISVDLDDGIADHRAVGDAKARAAQAPADEARARQAIFDRVWLLAFVATYGSLGWAVFAPPGRALTPALLTTALSLVGVCVVVYARLSLGRNIGFVPAQRSVVTSGAYRYVRHPIYTGLFLAWVSLCLRQFSMLNLSLFLAIFNMIPVPPLDGSHNGHGVAHAHPRLSPDNAPSPWL